MVAAAAGGAGDRGASDYVILLAAVVMYDAAKLLFFLGALRRRGGPGWRGQIIGPVVMALAVARSASTPARRRRREPLLSEQRADPDQAGRRGRAGRRRRRTSQAWLWGRLISRGSPDRSPRLRLRLAQRERAARARTKQPGLFQYPASAYSTSRQRALTSCISSMDWQRASRRRGEQTRTARHWAREMATFRRLREKRNDRLRGTSSPLEVAIEKKTTGAS